MSHIIDSLIAKIKFEIDSRALDALDAQLRRVTERITAFDTQFSNVARRMASVEAQQALANQRNARARQLDADANLRQQRTQESMAAGLDRLSRARLNYARSERELANITDAGERRAHEANMVRLRAELAAAQRQHTQRMRYLRFEEIAQNIQGRTSLLNIRSEANARQREHSLEMMRIRQQLNADNNASRERLANIRAEGAARGGSARLGGVLGMLNSPLAGALAVGGMGASFLMSGIVNPARQMASLESAFTSLTGSKAAARDELGFVRQQADYLGLEFGGSAEQYKGIFAAAATNKDVGTAGARQIFKGFGSMSTVLGLNTEQQQRMYKAIGQMLSKEQVMSEELKGQLAESYPAAMSLFTRAYSQVNGKEVSVKQFMEMMQKGKVGSDVVLAASRLAEQDANKGGALTERRQSSLAAQNRASNSIGGIQDQIYFGGVSDALSRFFNAISKVNENGSSVVDMFARGISKIIDLLTGFVGWISSPEGMGVIEDLGKIFGFVFEAIETIALPAIKAFAALIENELVRKLLIFGFAAKKAVDLLDGGLGKILVALPAITGFITTLGNTMLFVLAMVARHPLVAMAIAAGAVAAATGGWLGRKVAQWTTGETFDQDAFESDAPNALDDLSRSYKRDGKSVFPEKETYPIPKDPLIFNPEYMKQRSNQSMAIPQAQGSINIQNVNVSHVSDFDGLTQQIKAKTKLYNPSVGIA
jgi:tape measure domain-containing protein